LCTYSVGDEAVTAFEWVLIFNQLTNYQCHRFDVSCFVQVLLLDEITVDLDVLARADLMTFLRSECEERGATIIYATHIFDGLESWPTHIVSLQSWQVNSASILSISSASILRFVHLLDLCLL
jgi:ABC-type enterochelin transport system ATPase subunit